jgi:hypothetical protein
MPDAQDLDFAQIAPRSGGKCEAFEELCCQLARLSLPENVSFTRLHGAGGDGGVECFADFPDGTRVGWQAKFVFKVDSLIQQADASLTTALRVHPTLNRYIVCFPFNPTGTTNRRGKSGCEKLVEWCASRKKEAADNHRELNIELWSASELTARLLQQDVSGGLRFYFFNETVLGDDWFERHLEQVIDSAGPRYTPKLNVETSLFRSFEAFGQTAAHTERLNGYLRQCHQAYKMLEKAAGRTSVDTMTPLWPEALYRDGHDLLHKVESFIGAYESVSPSAVAHISIFDYSGVRQHLEEILGLFRDVETKLLEDLRNKHPDWGGEVDSPRFRQFMAAYMGSFPAANLDVLRETAAPFRDFHDWLRSPEGFMAFESVFLLTGEAGVGKTHSICDVARRRQQEGLRTCIVFGHAFGNEPDPWSCILKILGLPMTLGRDDLLDALNAAGEASGYPLLLCIDAINETRPLKYWRDNLQQVVHAVGSRKHLKLCISCRTPYVPLCIPDGIPIPRVECMGFEGAEDYACREFFKHYDLEPPVDPILQPELKNPLYLRLACETLRSKRMKQLPSGWKGLSPVIREFISHKEKEFAILHEVNQHAKIVWCALRTISEAVAQTGNAAIPLSSALRAIQDRCPMGSNLPVLDWLIRNGLLIEEVPVTGHPLDQESAVRPAFERLGDFLVACSLLTEFPSENAIRNAFYPGGKLHSLVRSEEAVVANLGVIGALSILIPEQHVGVELTDLIDEGSVRLQILKIVLDNLPWRNPDTFTASTAKCLRKGLACREISFKTMDSILSVAWRPSSTDAFWLDSLLRTKAMAQRDAYWCLYLHLSYESSGAVRRLIDAAFKLPLERIVPDILERWGILLLLFAAAADRRIKDWATRAVARIFSNRPQIIPRVVERFLCCDDDAVRECALLSAYGALITTRNVQATGSLAKILCRSFHGRVKTTQYDNALIRDHVRCILELSEILGVLPEGCNPISIIQSVSGDWPLKIPEDNQVEQWAEVVRFTPDEFSSDFFKYSMNCLQPWMHAIPKTDMGRWILIRVAQDFGYVGSGCEIYDKRVFQKYGLSLAKPTWAERIGKKYQWIAMHQLASRLHDYVERKHDSWEPEPLRAPLILLEERKIDPTLAPQVSGNLEEDEPWWIATSADLDKDRQLSDEEWLSREDDVPHLEKMLSQIDYQEQKWWLLVAYPSWGKPSKDAEFTDPWRNVLALLRSYLVRKEDFTIARDYLLEHISFDRSMPESARWLYGFAGEYPWASPFNTEPEEWHGRRVFGQMHPAWNTLVVEWEYDASLPRHFHMLVPARTFFSLGDLWWNGRDGYRLLDGKTVFCDPSITGPDVASLLVDADELPRRLEKLGLRLIWTLVGSKQILGRSYDNQTLRRKFCQIGYLEEDGSILDEEQMFFTELR